MMTDRKNRRRTAILTVSVIGIGWLAVQGFFAWRSASLENRLEKLTLPQDLQRTLELAERLAWYRPGDVALAFRRAELAEISGDSPRAARMLSTIPDDAPEAARARYLEGLIHRNAYRVDDAERAFRKCLELDPRFLEARRALVGLLGVERRREEQRDALRDWIESGMAVVESLRLLAQSDVVIPPGTLDKSVDEGQILQQALEACPDSLHVRPALVRYLRNRGQLDEALAVADEGLRIHPDDAIVAIERFGALVEAGESDLAQEWIDSLPESWNDSMREPGRRGASDYWMALGDFHKLSGRWSEALTAYEFAIDIPEAFYRLAECFRALNRPDEVDKALRRHEAMKHLAVAAASVDPLRPGTEVMREPFRICVALGRKQEAHAWATEILRDRRDDSEARSFLESTHGK